MLRAQHVLWVPVPGGESSALQTAGKAGAPKSLSATGTPAVSRLPTGLDTPVTVTCCHLWPHTGSLLFNFREQGPRVVPDVAGSPLRNRRADTLVNPLFWVERTRFSLLCRL